MDTKLKKIRIAWVAALAVIIFALLWAAIVPFGSITYTTDFLSKDYFIGPLTPKDRLAGSEGRANRTLISEPVYFSLFTPRSFRTATVTVEYEKAAPVLEVGLRRDGTVWNYERRPLAVAALDALAVDPHTLRDGDLLLWQKELRYDSVKEFLAKLPPVDETAVYNYNLNAPTLLSGYASFKVPRAIAVGVRGNYVLNIYSGGEAIELGFTVHDLNLNKDADAIETYVYDASGALIVRGSLADDRGAAGVTSQERSFSLATPALKSGAYRFEFKANDDIVTDSITTRQSKLSFVGRVWLAETGRTDLKFYSDAASLTAQTTAAASKQEIVFDGKALDITQTYTQFKTDAVDHSRRAKEIRLKRDGVILAADGVFASSPEALFNPSPRQLGTEDPTQVSDLDYVIARYEPGSGFRRSTTFSLGNVYREKGAYSFMIAAPDVSKVPGGLEIKSVTVKLEGESLFGYIKKLLHI